MTSIEEAKARTASAVLDEIHDGMVVGLGTGTTATLAIELLGSKVKEGLKLQVCCTSLASEQLAKAHGMQILPMEGLATVDLLFDGADQIDGSLHAIKGMGGALLREKIVARAARRAICIVDSRKLVPRIGTMAVPLEVLPFARSAVAAALSSLGGAPIPRAIDDQLARTDQGNILIDCTFDPFPDLFELEAALQDIPGLLGHGLFLREFDDLLVGHPDHVQHIVR